MGDPCYNLRQSHPRIYVLFSVCPHKHPGILTVYMPMNEFPISAITKNLKFGGLNQQNFIILQLQRLGV